MVKSKYMNKIFSIVAIFLGISLKLGAQINPVQVNTTLFPPFSAFLVDYYESGSNKMMVNIVFNDYNEPSWDVYLKIRIESNNALIQTKPEFKPAVPLTIYPGSPVQLRGEDFAEYLSFNNILVSGVPLNEFVQNGKLPEGLYNFFVEVCDYSSGNVISNTSMATAFVTLGDPPLVIAPNDGSFISTELPMNISFQWQLPTPPPDPSYVNYILKLYEITDSAADPQYAITNNQVIPVFESEPVMSIMYIYNAGCPQLEIGKKYVYTVQAVDTRGRSAFKNNGLSEPHWFYYGYPANGNIQLTFPANTNGFAFTEQAILRWNAANNLEPNQPVNYYIRIVQVNEGQTADEAMQTNNVWNDYTTITFYHHTPESYIINKKLEPMQEYAWQVTAFSVDQEVAKSDIWTFVGPPVIDNFLAGTHEVLVTKTFNSDLTQLDGIGRIILDASGSYADVEFNNLNIEETGNIFILQSGQIIGPATNIQPLEITPVIAENQSAFFYPDSIKLNTASLFVKGELKWDFPFGVTGNSSTFVNTESKWYDYGNYMINDYAFIDQETSYQLLEPYNFTLKLTTNSHFLIASNRLILHLYGNIKLPGNIDYTDGSDVVIPFDNVNQLFYNTSYNINLPKKIKLINNTDITLKPTTAIIDLSENDSPLKFAQQPDWKGVYFQQSELYHAIDIDPEGQIILDQQVVESITLDANNNFEAWATTPGLELFAEKNYPNNKTALFNTFPARALSYKIDISNSNLNSAYFKGDIKIPLISETQNYAFTVPITSYGFQDGYLDQSLDGLSFIFNEGGGEQELQITINSAVFADHERLDMGLDMFWPALGITMQGVTGFKAWGSYKIGFSYPNGAVALTNQLTGSMQGYQVTVTTVGCGSSKGMYAFGTAANIILSGDIAGANGPPVANIYCMAQNSFLDTSEVYSDANQIDSTYFLNQINNLNNQINGYNNNYNLLSDNINGDHSQLLNDLNNLQSGQSIPGAQDYDLNEILGNTSGSGQGGHNSGGSSLENTIDKIDQLAGIVAPEQYQSVQNMKNFVSSLSETQINIVSGNLSNVHSYLLSIIKGKVDSIVVSLTDPINNKAIQLNGIIQAKIDSLVGICENYVGSLVDSTFDNVIEPEIIGWLGDDALDLENQVHDLCDDSKSSVKDEIFQSINDAVSEDIRIPITNLIMDNLTERISHSIEVAIWASASQLLENGFNGNIQINTQAIIDSVEDELLADLELEKLLSDVLKTGEDAYKNFNFNDVWENIKDNFSLTAEDVFNAVVNTTQSQIANIANNMANGLIGDDMSLSFGNNAQKLVNGEITSIYVLDPIYIKINTNVAIFEGLAEFTDEDPLWGDSWKASVSAQIKIQPTFTANATFINGKTSSFQYWFLELEVESGGLSIPLTPLPLNMTGVSGKVFHHMTFDGTNYTPDNLTSYGAGIEMQIESSDGYMLKMDLEVEVEFMTGGFSMTLAGEALIGVSESGSYLAIGTGYINYNSVNKHFLGYFTAHTETDPFMCVDASLIIDIKSSNNWFVALGTPDNRVIIKPLCPIALQADGFLMVDNNGMDLDVHIGYSYYIEASEWIDVKLIQVKPYATAGFDFNALCSLNWEPFGIENAMVSIELYAAIGAHWKSATKSGTWNLAAVWLYGMLQFQTMPDTKIAGELSGKVTIVGVSVDFSLKADHTFS